MTAILDNRNLIVIKYNCLQDIACEMALNVLANEIKIQNNQSGK